MKALTAGANLLGIATIQGHRRLRTDEELPFRSAPITQTSTLRTLFATIMTRQLRTYLCLPRFHHRSPCSILRILCLRRLNPLHGVMIVKYKATEYQTKHNVHGIGINVIKIIPAKHFLRAKIIAVAQIILSRRFGNLREPN